ncbi:unnamed protein product [Paramecium sonneborni]|uniref:Uncharacterized protein n=1 Tax=Paramecium sonneborni TaxID=65129 RepID=A0A8S1N630_9CILI|nr:unnamed protein product [Paramecium sonneborni]
MLSIIIYSYVQFPQAENKNGYLGISIQMNKSHIQKVIQYYIQRYYGLEFLRKCLTMNRYKFGQFQIIQHNQQEQHQKQQQ